MTAAAFGVPLTLVVLSGIGMAQAKSVEARAARRLAGQVAGGFASSVPRLLLGPSAVLDEAATGLLALERAAQQAIRNWESGQGDAGLTDLRQLLEGGALERALDGFRSAARPGMQAVPAVAEVTAHWSFLNTTVRSRLLETGVPWLAPPLATRSTRTWPGWRPTPS